MNAWPDPMLEALWLTAQRWDDPSLNAVLRVLPAKVSAEIAARGARRSALTRGAKARAVAQVVASLHPGLAHDAPLPPRALSLLAADVPRDVGRTWLKEGGKPRAGYRVDPRLKVWLRRLGRAETPR